MFQIVGTSANLLGDNTNTITKLEALTYAKKKAGLQETIEKNKYIFIPHHQRVQHNLITNITNRFFKSPNIHDKSAVSVICICDA
jgi:hypothetical protein